MECRHCGTHDQRVRGQLRYFHLFFIPFLITKKEILVECNHSRKVSYFTDLNKFQINTLKKAVFPFKKMWGYYFIPLAVIVLFLLSFIMQLFA